MIRAMPLLAVLAVACGGAACPEGAQVAASAAPARRAPPVHEAPTGTIRARPIAVHPGPDGFLLLLADEERRRVLPVVIGLAEAQIIDLRMRGERFERPLTHDLLDSMVRELGGQVLYVHIDKLRGGVFVGSIHVWDGRTVRRIDSRTSDAVAVALGHDVPIYVATVVFDEAGEDISGALDGDDEPM